MQSGEPLRIDGRLHRHVERLRDSAEHHELRIGPILRGQRHTGQSGQVQRSGTGHVRRQGDDELHYRLCLRERGMQNIMQQRHRLHFGYAQVRGRRVSRFGHLQAPGWATVWPEPFDLRERLLSGT
jgi:hypothetical protein